MKNNKTTEDISNDEDDINTSDFTNKTNQNKDDIRDLRNNAKNLTVGNHKGRKSEDWWSSLLSTKPDYILTKI